MTPSSGEMHPESWFILQTSFLRLTMAIWPAEEITSRLAWYGLTRYSQSLQCNVWSSPQHSCSVCQQGEGASDRGQLIPCARCPVAYHLLCLPQQVLDSETYRVWLNKQGELIRAYLPAHLDVLARQ